MVVAVVVVRMVQTPVDQIVHVIAMGDRLVSAARAVDVLGVVELLAGALVAPVGVSRVDGQRMVIDMVAMRVVEVAVVDEVDVAVVDDCDMAAARTMDVLVIVVGMVAVAHRHERYVIWWAPARCNARCARKDKPGRAPKGAFMRLNSLRTALHAFSTEAAWQLASDAHAGDELAFEVVEGGRRDTPLYCYRPLIGAFIGDHAGALSRLPTYLPATQALITSGRLEAWLEAQGRHAAPGRERADMALHCFLERVFDGSTDFVFNEERFDTAFRELEGILADNAPDTVLVAVLEGVELACDSVDLGDGLTLERGDSFDEAPDEARWSRADGASRTLAVLRWESDGGGDAKLADAHDRLRRMLLGLRLYDSTAVALEPLAWVRVGAAPWQPFGLGAPMAARGVLVIEPERVEDLRTFLALVARHTPRHGEVAWALRRFELAGERSAPAEALTDLLLALRALLEPEGPVSSELPGRLAALCAEASGRAALTARIAQIVLIEQAIVTGRSGGPEVAEAVTQLAGHLRALLRDVLCGHLDADLARIADAIVGRPVPTLLPPEAEPDRIVRTGRLAPVEDDVFF